MNFDLVKCETSRQITHVRYGLNYNPPCIAIFYKQCDSDTKTRLYKINLNSLVYTKDTESITKQLFVDHPEYLNAKTASFDQIQGLVKKLIPSCADQDSTESSEAADSVRASQELQSVKTRGATLDNLPISESNEDPAETSETVEGQFKTSEKRIQNPLAQPTKNIISSIEEMFNGSKNGLYLDTLNNF